MITVNRLVHYGQSQHYYGQYKGLDRYSDFLLVFSSNYVRVLCDV